MARRSRIGRPDLGERGATLVEYALIMALVVFAAVASIEFLTDRSDREVNNQADCVSMRPPPPSCQVGAIPPNFVPNDPGYSTPTTAPPVGPPAPQATVVLPALAGPTPAPPDTTWFVEVAVSVQTPAVADPPFPAQPLAGAPVSARVRLVDPANPAVFLGFSEFVSCTTDASGSCTLRYDVIAPFLSVNALRVDQITVNTSPAAAITPANLAIDAVRP